MGEAGTPPAPVGDNERDNLGPKGKAAANRDVVRTWVGVGVGIPSVLVPDEVGSIPIPKKEGDDGLFALAVALALALVLFPPPPFLNNLPNIFFGPEAPETAGGGWSEMGERSCMFIGEGMSLLLLLLFDDENDKADDPGVCGKSGVVDRLA